MRKVAPGTISCSCMLTLRSGRAVPLGLCLRGRRKLPRTDGGFYEVRRATRHSARCHRRFNCFRSGPDAPRAGSKPNPGAGPASPADPDPIDIVADVHRLPGQLRYAGHELPKFLCRCRTYDEHSQSGRHCTVHPQLHHATARLQAGVQQQAAAVAARRAELAS
jgi:hypothetical protein